MGVQNRHLFEATFKFDASINDNLENDLYSTAKISCSEQWFEIDPADIHIKGGKQKDEMRDNGDYVKGKEAGVTVRVTPKHYSTGPRNVKFSILCVFKTKIQIKDDKSDKDKKSKEKEPIDTEMPYILDFDLGPPKTPQMVGQPLPSMGHISESNEVKDTVAKPSHKSRKSNENMPKAND